MDVKIIITGPTAQRAEHEATVSQRGDLTKEIGIALAVYHRQFPDAPPFEHTIKVDHA